MTKEKAINLAIAAIRKEIKKIAYDANMQKIFRVDTPHAINSLKRKEELLQAIETLEIIKASNDSTS